MPRLDRTFSDTDLCRIYNNNLTNLERKNALICILFGDVSNLEEFLARYIAFQTGFGQIVVFLEELTDIPILSLILRELIDIVELIEDIVFFIIDAVI